MAAPSEPTPPAPAAPAASPPAAAGGLVGRRGKIALVGLLALAGAVGMTYRGWAPRDPTWKTKLEYPNLGAYRGLDPAHFTSAETCSACHPTQYAEWKESGMGRSSRVSNFEIELYKASLDLRGLPVEEVQQCLHCHAPVALMGAELDLERVGKVASEGVTCDVCHTAVQAWPNDAPGMIRWDPTGPKRGPLWGTSDETPPPDAVIAVSPFHGTAHSDLHKGSDLCGACHMSLWPTNALPVDWTWAEWARSPYAAEGKGCPQCHMPTYDGVAAVGGPERKGLHRHTFPGGGDLEMVRKTATLDVSVEAQFAGEVVSVRVENVGAGHAFPTGNATAPCVTLKLVAKDAAGAVVYEDDRKYRLVYGDINGVPVSDPSVAYKVLSDTTLQPREPRHEHFFIPRRLGAATVHAELEYRRWNEELVTQHAALVGEFLTRYAREGVRLHRLIAQLDKLDPAAIQQIRDMPVILAAEDDAVVPPPPVSPL